GRSLRIAEPIKPVSGAFTKQCVEFFTKMIAPIARLTFAEKRRRIFFSRTPTPTPPNERSFPATVRQHARVRLYIQELEEVRQGARRVRPQIFISDPTEAVCMRLGKLLRFGHIVCPPRGKLADEAFERVAIHAEPAAIHCLTLLAEEPS